MNISVNRFYVLAVLFAFCCPALIAQTSLAGIINQYSPVSAVDFPGSAVVVSDPSPFAIGDRVLLIQMQGASIDDSDSNSFGDVSAYGGAGSYEMATVCEVSGNNVIMENDLANTDYDPASGLQLVTVPAYDDAEVVGELTGLAWDGTSGGVVAFAVDNDLLLNAPIVMDGKGFRGGGFENNASNCNFAIPVNDYFYAAPLDGGGRKGESFAAYVSAREYGRGAQAGGGGGGNDHNSGGGGGANAGAGGVGGRNVSTALFNCSGNFPGRGGKVPALTANRFFMGSGGGAGDGNNSIGTSGGNGGGIILIFAETLTVGASATISANGTAAANTVGGDGSGGGGAGGSVLLEVGTVSGAPVLSATGGNGGDVDNENNNRCFGPGGGGGGGVIRTNAALTGSSLNVDGGTNGVSFNTPVVGCTGSTGTQSGDDGVVLNEAIPQGIAPSACLSLPVSWQDITLQQVPKATLLSWSVAEQVNNDYFTVERSTDGEHFEDLARVPATTANDYTFTDADPLAGLSFYRVKQTDFDGRYSYSSTVSSWRAYTELRLYPSLVRSGQTVTLELPDALSDGKATISFVDQSGRSVRQKTRFLAQEALQLETTGLPAGVYLVNLRAEQLNWTGRLVIRRP